MGQSSVTLTSYNSREFNLQRQQYLSKFCVLSDLIFCQEHFQLKNCKYKKRNALNSEYEFYFKPAVKDFTILSAGRPKAGIFKALKKSILKKVTRV